MLCRRVGTDCDDVINSAYLECHRSLRGLRNDKCLEPWVYRIVCREVAHYQSKEYRESTLSNGPSSVPTPNYVRSLMLDRAISLIPTIYPAKYRAILESEFLHGKPANNGTRSMETRRDVPAIGPRVAGTGWNVIDRVR
jgi:DNA-directed RNA polymerase specialized sigma24 family protein